MAQPATVSWEVRTTGSDSNGGGFNTASAGTDYSQQDTPHVTFDGVTIYGTYSSTTTVIIHGYVVAATDIGNVLNITGGTNYTVGRYVITAVNTGTNSWTMSSACETAGATGMTGFMGGGLLTIAEGLVNVVVAGQVVWVQNGTYNITSALTATLSSTATASRLIGYITNHTTVPLGTNRPTISTGTNAINALTMTGRGWYVQNLIFSSTSSGVVGISATTDDQISNVKVSGFATGVILLTSGSLYNSEVTACTTAGVTTTGAIISDCWIHDMTCVGISCATNPPQITYCLITNCTGATSDGILSSIYGGTYIANTIYRSGRDALRLSSGNGLTSTTALNNIFANSGEYGVNVVTANFVTSQPTIDFNGYYSNASGNTNNLIIGGGSATLAASPFNNPAGNDFSLNNTLSGGASLRNAALPQTMPGLATPQSYNDIGLYRHQDNTGPVTNNLFVLLD